MGHSHVGSIICPPSTQLCQLSMYVCLWPLSLAYHDGVAHDAMLYIPESAKDLMEDPTQGGDRMSSQRASTS